MSNKIQMQRIVIILLFTSLFAQGQSWHGLMNGVNSTVSSMIIDPNNNLILGGSFTEVNGNPQMGLAVWDSLSLMPFGNNANFGNNFGNVLCMTYFNGDLVIGGHFDSINNVAVNNIARWDGANWQPIGNGFDQNVHTVISYNNKLYAGGVFWTSGLDTVRTFAVWNGSNWVNAAHQIDGYVWSSLIMDGKLILGGPFNRIDGVTYGGIASWNDTAWSNVGVGFNNEVYNLSIVDDTLYACGTFTQIPQNQTSYLAKYDGTNWHQVTYPVGTTLWTSDIVKFHDEFFVCGNFNNPDDLGVINGSLYDSIGSTNGWISELIVYKDQLYVGGNFSIIGNQNITCVAVLDSFLVSNGNYPSIQHSSNYIFPTIISQNSYLNMSKDFIIEDKLVDATIYSISGVAMARLTIEAFPFLVNELPAASYIIKFNFKNGQCSSQKFIVIP